MCKTYLITGAAGFIGINFVKYITDKINQDDKLVLVDKLTYAANSDEIDSIASSFNVACFRLDISSPSDMEFIFDKYHPTHIINFAAESHVDNSLDSGLIFGQSNIIGTQVLLDQYVKHKDEIECMIQISTDEIYGSLQRFPDGSCEVIEGFDGRPETRFGPCQFGEDLGYSPNSPYSASKAAAELMCQAYMKSHGLKVYITRCSNNYGPYQHEEKFIPHVIKNLIEGKKIPVYGDGKQVRDWIYVEDHCKGIWSILMNPNLPSNIYNFGGANELTNLNLILLIMTHSSFTSAFPSYEGADLNDVVEFVKDRKAHDVRYAMDFTKANRDLGFAPTANHYEAFKTTIEFYINKFKR